MELREAEGASARRERINVRCLNLRTKTTAVAEAKIIRHNYEEVGTSIFASVSGCHCWVMYSTVHANVEEGKKREFKGTG